MDRVKRRFFCYDTAMNKEVEQSLIKAVNAVGIEATALKLEYPENHEHGDFSSNVAMANAKKLKMSPKALADKIVAEFSKNMPESVASVEVAGPGFINLKIKDGVFTKKAVETAVAGKKFDANKADNSKQVMVEYTDPNTFKVFHIGHLMSNSIGESIARLTERSGAKVIRICYPSDIGLHIAKSVWALQKHLAEMPKDDAPIAERTDFLGKMYVEGTRTYESDPAVKDDIDALNKVLYERSSPTIDALYQKGRKWSLDHFEQIYKILGTKFVDTICESEIAPVGLAIVKANVASGIFEDSDGAIVFKGEKYGLHTRVFVNSHGFPTYEAKDVGLNVTKFKKYPDAIKSVVITASEQNAYFSVIKKVLSLVDEKNGSKTVHIGHGMMRFAQGKMSSRTGNVITAEALIADIKDMVKEKIAGRGLPPNEVENIAEVVAIGAIKYTILRSSVGSDIIFDSTASISFEGDSGPYLQYSAVRAHSILEKAQAEGIKLADAKSVLPDRAGLLERLIVRYPEITMRACEDLAPQTVASYLISLAGAFNGFYASQMIVDKNDPLSPYRVALTKAFLYTMTDGLEILGIKVPEKM